MRDYISRPEQDYLKKNQNLRILSEIANMLRDEADCDRMHLIVFVDQLKQLSPDHHFL